MLKQINNNVGKWPTANGIIGNNGLYIFFNLLNLLTLQICNEAFL